MCSKPRLHHARKVRAQAGMSLVEFVIASAITGLVLAQVCLLWFYSSRSFAAQMSYTEMDQRSQRALDTLSQNIRQVKSMTAFAPDRIVFKDYDDLLLSFAFEKGQLVRTKNGVPKTLLKDCQSGAFEIFQRTPIAGGFEHYATTNPAVCKMVEVRWVCGRKLFPTAPTTSESIQSARITVRANN